MRLLYTFAFVFCFSWLAAQPTQPFPACHQAHNQVTRQPLTPEQERNLVVSQTRSDSIDLLNYSIDLDITNFNAARIDGSCTIDFSLLEADVQEMSLDLLNLEVDSVQLNGVTVPYTYDDLFVTLSVAGLDTENDHQVTVYYGGQPTVAASNFGGLAFTNEIAYNLGIGLGENPYNYGRSWFPCFDNFVERATFDLNIISSDGRKAYCSGHFQSETDLGDGRLLRSYRIDQPMTTYLVGVAVSDYQTIDSEHTGTYGTYPVQLIARPGDLGAMDDTFIELGDCIDMLESWYGPYIWGRVGYVLTPVGAMEHVNSIAYPRQSGTTGPTPDNNRLMAHELAHHWWGNVTTLSSPANMWIKEGNAEYGAHLFTEYTRGREAFIDQVRTNHLRVLENAHIDDDGFQPLANIPYEHTYGTHTYLKGASMLHNMRTYLGDSLFRTAQSATLEEFRYQAVDAEQYRDFLTENSGVDMTNFFNDWIFGTGWSNFELNEVVVTPNGSSYDIDLQVQQRLRGADNLHTGVPLSVTFFTDDWQEDTRYFTASGDISDASFTLDFEPRMTIINYDHGLNLGRYNRHYRITETGALNTAGIEMFNLSTEALADSALLNIVHHWTAPDPHSNPDIVMSNTHYWSFQSIAEGDFALKGIFRYEGSINSLDFDLAQAPNETVRLMYRPTPDTEWEVYEDVNITPFGNGGLARIDPILPGDYALANYYVDVSTTNVLEQAQITVSPNPVTDHARISIDFAEAQSDYELQLFDLQGRLLRTATLAAAPQVSTEWSLAALPAGTYVLNVSSESGFRALEVIKH